jgi:hypothetical protein
MTKSSKTPTPQQSRDLGPRQREVLSSALPIDQLKEAFREFSREDIEIDPESDLFANLKHDINLVLVGFLNQYAQYEPLKRQIVEVLATIYNLFELFQQNGISIPNSTISNFYELAKAISLENKTHQLLINEDVYLLDGKYKFIADNDGLEILPDNLSQFSDSSFTQFTEAYLDFILDTQYEWNNSQSVTSIRDAATLAIYRLVPIPYNYRRAAHRIRVGKHPEDETTLDSTKTYFIPVYLRPSKNQDEYESEE